MQVDPILDAFGTKIGVRVLPISNAPNGVDVPEQPEPVAETITVGNVDPESVKWLWEPRIALGKLTVLCGDAGLGKSFVSLDIASRLSQGRSWPDAREETVEAADTILLNCEDGIADTIRPRLDNHGADVNRIHVLRGVRHPEDDSLSMVNLERDCRHIAALLENRPAVRLVVVDPLSPFLGKECDSHRDADVRRVMGPVVELAAEHNVAILAVMHLNKATALSALYRASGSVAFTAASRCAWLICRDKEDPTKRLMLQLKNNLAPDPGGLGFHISHPGVVMWDANPVAITADEALSDTRRTRTARDEAEAFLRELLADGPMPSAEVYEDAEANGINKRTLKRAKAESGARARKQMVDGKPTWFWELTENE